MRRLPAGLKVSASLGVAFWASFAASLAHAAPTPTEGADALLSRPLVLLVALALVSMVPFAFMALTAFLKISTVLHIAKSAIGVQSVPSTTVVLALSAALTLLAMAPVGARIGERLGPLVDSAEAGGSQPASAEPASAALDSAEFVTRVFEATAEPLRTFLGDNASGREVERFHRLAENARKGTGPAAEKSDFRVLIPAFMVSELGEAFALGFAIFLPFLVIDLIVGNVLLALGMQMMSPSQVSLPFKLLLFVAADGWGLLAEALVTGYR